MILLHLSANRQYEPVEEFLYIRLGGWFVVRDSGWREFRIQESEFRIKANRNRLRRFRSSS
jgi:hypothetical protein